MRWYVVCAVLFLAGLFFLILAVDRWQHARSWVASSASTVGTVIGYETKEYKNKRGGKDLYFAPIITFMTLEGDEIAFTDSHFALPPDYQVGEKLPVLYQPQKPHNASLKRFRAIWAPTVVLFVLGALFSGFSILFYRHLRKDESASILTNAEQTAAFIRKRWKGGVAIANTRVGMWIMWVFTILWSAFTIPMLINFLPGTLGVNLASAGLLFFPALNLFLYYLAIRVTLQWLKFRRLAMVMEPFPWILGSEVSGSVALPEGIRPEKVEVRIACKRLVTDSSGRDRHTTVTTVWQSIEQGGLSDHPSGNTLNFKVSLPAGLPGTDVPSDDYHQWEVLVSATLPGTDLNQVFEVPVLAQG